MKEWQKEYLKDAAFGYLNGFNDVGRDEYPPMTLKELIAYTWETIAYERELEPAARSIYFTGKANATREIERIIKSDSEFKAIVTDWN